MGTFAELLDGLEYQSGAEYRGLVVGDAGLGDVEFEACSFRECGFGSATLRRVVFRDCAFVDCDLSLMTLTDCRFVECRMTRCRALGVAWAGAERSLIAQVPFAFDECNLDLGSFQGADVAGSVFQDCSLREVDFSDADLRRVDFGGSDLARAAFARSDLRDANFVGARNVALDPRENRIRGAQFSVDGALDLLAVFGVVVR